MFPSMVMPLTSSMSRVALPVIRDHFQLQADMAAWIATAFMLPFMILMPVYGRLSDGLGKRRLILAGIAIFSIGTAMATFASDLPWLMVGRAIQGIGVGGIMPLGMALISTIFHPDERGKALGTWSAVGPTTAFIGPLFAGFLIERWGWRAAFGPPMGVGVIAFLVVVKTVPPRLDEVKHGFLRSFDWVGAGLLAGTMISLLFYLSSRPVTGVPPLQDWRLASITTILMVCFLWWEKRREAPFVALNILRSRAFSTISFCASMRMFVMGGLSFLVPLYLADVRKLSVTHIGIMAMINPGAMSLIVRFGGQAADRWGSRWPVVIGLTIQALVILIFSQLPDTAPMWGIGIILASHGLAAGLMLAALHRAAMRNISEAQMGMAAGLYSMLRFVGSVIGTALGGVLLQIYLDRPFSITKAYQRAFLFFAGISILGIIAGLGLKEAENRKKHL
jgi:EmrB/QacA subfamily drug resistance transporter